jgi:TDG/mug DNA glycosylase family protein
MLPDLLAGDLVAVFVGTSVSTTSADKKHYYAHPSNRFWELLDATGLTGGAGLTSDRDREITDYGVGLTDLVKVRAASSDGLLESSDYDLAGFIARIERARPFAVAFNGGKAARMVARHLKVAVVREGPTSWCVAGAAAYVLPSSSATNTRMAFAEKTDRWRAFGEWERELQAGARH